MSELIRIDNDDNQLQTKEIAQLPIVATFPDAYKSAIKVFNKWLDGRPVNIENIIEYLHEQQKTKKPATISTMKYGIKKAIKHLMSYGARKVDVALLDEAFKEVKVGKRDPKVYAHKLITKKQLSIIYKKAPPKTALLIRTLAETGMRISELTSIKLKDCTVSGDYVYIYIIGKGSKEREIFITKSLFDEIKKVYNGNEYLFEHHTGKRLNRTVVWRDVHNAGKLAGRDDLHPHHLRHYFATDTLLVKKRSLKAVSQYLGHADTAITSSVYVEDQLTPNDIFRPKR